MDGPATTDGPTDAQSPATTDGATEANGPVALHRACWAVIVLSACAAVLVRFAAASPLWLDEALSVNIASLPFADAVAALRRDGHPVLYYAALGIWIDLFNDSDAATRALSGLCSLATVPVIWAAARRRLDAETARFAAVLALTSPFLVRYGSEVRMYAQVALLAAVAWLLTEIALQRPRVWCLTALAASVAAGLHTHYWMIWPTAAATALLAVAWLRRAHLRPGLTPLLVAYGCGWAAFAPWTGVLVEQAAHTGTPWARWARPAEVFVESVEAIGGGTRFEPTLLGMILAGAATLGALLLRRVRCGVVLSWPGHNPSWPLAAVTTIAMCAGGLAALASASAFEARYAAVVLPFVLVLAGRGLTALPKGAALSALALIAAFSVAVSVDEARRDRSQGQEVAEAINADAADGDTVLACPDQLAPTVVRYLDKPLPVLTFPSTDDPSRVDWYDYRSRIDGSSPEATARSALEEAGAEGAVWLVSASGYLGFGGSCETLASELSSTRPSRRIVAARAVYEPMLLRRFAADAP